VILILLLRENFGANLNCNLNLVLFYIKIYVHTINSKDIILYKNKDQIEKQAPRIYLAIVPMLGVPMPYMS
jgi:hypothetical protein